MWLIPSTAFTTRLMLKLEQLSHATFPQTIVTIYDIFLTSLRHKHPAVRQIIAKNPDFYGFDANFFDVV